MVKSWEYAGELVRKEQRYKRIKSYHRSEYTKGSNGEQKGKNGVKGYTHTWFYFIFVPSSMNANFII